MELGELSRWIAKEAKRIQAELKSLPSSMNEDGSSKSTQSTESTLSRIEERLKGVHMDTGMLLERIPGYLFVLLSELKQSILERVDSLRSESTESNRSRKSNISSQTKSDWLREAMKSLTPQEQRLFQACFQSGLITYKELAKHLDVTPTSAKNIVNRLFQSAEKRGLFRKQRVRGIARVGITEAIEQDILRGRPKGSPINKNTEVSKDIKALKRHS